MSIHKEIEQRLSKRKKGQLIFLSDFRDIGSQAAIKKALSRLSNLKKIKRIAHGIYSIPKVDPVFGEINPSMEAIAEAVAKKEHVKIKPTGAYALNKLGLTTQVPTRIVYLTDGQSRQIKIGKGSIKFKATTPKKFALEGEISGLVVQALEELGVENINDDTRKRIKELLLKEDKKKIMNDLKLASVQISNYLYSLLKEQEK
jgi:predicted transcriptional regulator of viral defense system